MSEQGRETVLRGVRTHNLKGVSARFPHRRLTVVSGVSGSGKSSLAFDTLYAEGQRRFVESLSTYARQFLQRMERPPVEQVTDIQPAVALQQKNSVKNARSTVATLTELSDHLHLIYTHIGVTRCTRCGEVVRRESAATVAERLEQVAAGSRLYFVAEVPVLEIETPQQVLEALVAEGYRRLWLDGAAVLMEEVAPERLLRAQAFEVVVDRQKAQPGGDPLRLREAIEQAFRLGRERLTIHVESPAGGEALVFDKAFRCNACRTPQVEPIPQLFSSNSPLGACEACSGFGRVAGVDLDKVIPNPELTLEGGAVSVWETEGKLPWKRKLLKKAMERGYAIDIPYRALPEEARRFVVEGGKGFGGVEGFFATLEEKRFKPSHRILLARYRGYTPCKACGGSRLSPAARAVSVDGRTIDQLLGMTVREAAAYFDAAPPRWPARDRARVEPLLEEIQSRLRYLMTVGLGYLSLGRPSRTLSGGEVQRIHLTSSLGRMLTDTLYVLDEPTAGLHPRDSLRLLSVLHALRDIGNTVVVVEHDPDIIQGADHVIELGPCGGERGGRIVFEGDVESLKAADTPTGDAFQRRVLTAPPGRVGQGSLLGEGPQRWLRVVGARENNLQGVTAAFPLGRLTCVTGVSGSGKSTLVHACLYEGWRRLQGIGGAEAGRFEALEGTEEVSELVLMGQGGLGRSKRSTVASYTKAWDGIRKLYGESQGAARLGLGPGHFSFNTPGGRCERCEGTGTVLVEMHFMADLEIVCEDCEGRRFTERVLSVKVRGRTIHDVLQLTVEEALQAFEGRAIQSRLKPLVEVGLGYLRLGQTTNTLSGGEAQRLMLASYVGKGQVKAREGVAFLFDEPTIGLHLQDVEVLVRALRKVVDAGHTVIVVEHNTDLIAQADWVIDMGPEGGDGGGTVVVAGPPAAVAAHPTSHTGRFLAELLPGGVG